MSAVKKHSRICIYCGSPKKITADHVPPKLLLSKPYPPNLLTVPCCRDCNASFQSDDEYTRAVVSIDVRGSRNQDVQANLPAIIRSLQRPNANVFAAYLASRTTESMILGTEGTPMGDVVDVEHARVNTTGGRMRRALFFVEMGRALEPAARLKVAARANVSPRDPLITEFARVYSGCAEHRSREIGSAFSYVAGFGHGYSVWIMLLYDFFCWAGTVDERGP